VSSRKVRQTLTVRGGRKKTNRKRAHGKKLRQLTKEAFIKAIKNSFGNISVIALRLNCERQTVYNWLHEHPELQALIDSERERIIDLAENKLVGNLKKGKDVTVHFVLRTLGKNRGYTEKQEIEHSGSIEERVRNMTEEERQKRKRELMEKLEREKKGK
jgi:hypothetical protein